MGLGDSLYLQSVVGYFVGKGYRVEVCSAWPDVFLPLAGKVVVSPFRRRRIDRLAHYTSRKSISGTTQFQDCCINAGISEPVALRLNWKVRNLGLVDLLRRAGRPIILVQLPRAPMGRSDGFGAEVLPDCRAIQCAIDTIGGRALVVQIGCGEPLYRFTGVDVDLANRTSVSDVIDLAASAHGLLGYCSFIVPLAESLGKPALLVWSRRGLNSEHDFVRAITPRKVLHLASSRFVIDDCSQQEISEAVDALCEQIAGPRQV